MFIRKTKRDKVKFHKNLAIVTIPNRFYIYENHKFIIPKSFVSMPSGQNVVLNIPKGYKVDIYLGKEKVNKLTIEEAFEKKIIGLKSEIQRTSTDESKGIRRIKI